MAKEDSNGRIDYRYDGFGRLVKAGDSVYDYDKNGNLNSRKAPEKSWRLKYDGTGQLVRLQSSRQKAQYKYDGLGNLVFSKENGKATRYLPNLLAPLGYTLAEYGEERDLFYTYGETLLACREKGESRYFLEDGFGSVRQVVDQRGEVIGRADYSPFGEVIFREGEVPGFRTAGERYLPGAGLCLIGNRPYDPQTGRYLTPDPVPPELTRFDTFNKYAHGCRNPGVFTAPRCNQTGGNNLGRILFGRHDAFDPYGRITEEFKFEEKIRETVHKTLPLTLSPLTLFPHMGTPIYDVKRAVDIGAGRPPSTLETTASVLLWPALAIAGGMLGGTPGALVGVTIKPAVEWAAEGLATFYGTRMDRPYWWWSPMKWLPQEEYLRRERERALGGQPQEKDQERERKYTIDRKIPLFPPDGHNGGPPGGPGGGAAGTGLLPYEPLSSAEKQLGGISLEAAARLTGDFDLGHIKGAVRDEKRQCLVLLGEENTALPSLKAADLAVALKCVIDSGQDPQFSLDPADPKNPRGPNLKPVYYGPIENTPFGQAMFEADWKLKEYSFGFKRGPDGQKQRIHSNVPGYQNIFDLSFEQSRAAGESFMRFWITCADAPLYQDGKSLYFGPVKMKVNTEKMFLAAKGLISSGGQQDPVAEKFASHFSQHYDEFAREEPSFARVKELAKAVALAKWLREQKIPVDMGWVEECLASTRVNTPRQVPALSHTEQRESRQTRGNVTTIQTLTLCLHGGVDLNVQPYNLGPVKELSTLKELVKEKLSSSGSSVFSLAQGRQNLKAVVLPLTREGESRWRKKEYIEEDGIKYYFTGQRVSRVVDELGNNAEFAYDGNGRLREINWVFSGGINNGGLEATAKKDGASSTLEISTPRKNKISYCFGPSGELNQIKINGKKYAALNSRPEMIEVDYGDYLEMFVANQKGKIVSYQFGRKDLPETIRILNFAYDEQGNLTELFGPETGRVTFAYAGNKPSSLQLPGGEVKYTYDRQGRLKSMVSSWGKALEYEYEGEQLKKVLLTSAGPAGEAQQAYALLDKGRVVESTDFSGRKTRYAYVGGNLSEVADAWGRKAGYEYDEKGRLKEVNLPDGGRIEYTYRKDLLAEVKLFPACNSRLAEQVSSRETAVLLAERRGRTTTLKFADRPEKTVANLERDLDVALGAVPGDREVAARRLQASLAGVAGDGRTVLVWAAETHLGPKLALFLTREMGVRAILTENPLRAAANLQKHRPLAGNASLVLLKGTFLKAQEEVITEEVAGLAFPQGKVATSLQEVPAEDNTVVIVAENNPRDREVLREQLQAAGLAGRLHDKFIVLQYCGEGKADVAEEILSWGASGVFFYENKVFIPAVGMVLREADAILEAKPTLKADEAFRQAILKALEKAREDATYRRLQPQLRDMLNHFTIALLEEEKVG